MSSCPRRTEGPPRGRGGPGRKCHAGQPQRPAERSTALLTGRRRRGHPGRPKGRAPAVPPWQLLPTPNPTTPTLEATTQGKECLWQHSPAEGHLVEAASQLAGLDAWTGEMQGRGVQSHGGTQRPGRATGRVCLGRGERRSRGARPGFRGARSSGPEPKSQGRGSSLIPRLARESCLESARLPFPGAHEGALTPAGCPHPLTRVKFVSGMFYHSFRESYPKFSSHKCSLHSCSL